MAKTQRSSLERRTYRELPSGRYHVGLVDLEGAIWTKIACPAKGLLTDVNDTTGSVPDALICPVCFNRE